MNEFLVVVLLVCSSWARHTGADENKPLAHEKKPVAIEPKDLAPIQEAREFAKKSTSGELLGGLDFDTGVRKYNGKVVS